MNTVVLSLGSNLGDRYTTLQNAISTISSKIGKVTAESFIYESEALGFESKDRFLNMCVQVETKLTPLEILELINSIEKENGRVRNSNIEYTSRSLDIDIIFYNDLILELPALKIPHPRFTERLFVLVPLNDITSDLLDQRTFLNVEQLLVNCQDKSVLTKYQF